MATQDTGGLARAMTGPGRATLFDLAASVRARLAEGGIAEAGTEARLLVRAALGLDAVAFLTGSDRPIAPDEDAQVDALVRRRLSREPLSRITGMQEFWSLPFALSPGTLVPRADSETVVDAALSLAGDAETVLDLGTGSGCLLVALLTERPSRRGLGIDRSPDALETARRNAVRNGVGDRALFALSDWTDAVGGPFDLVVSNPPYIASEAVAALEPEVREHDPRLALDGGPDGLDAYRRLFETVGRVMRDGAVGVFEIGFDQDTQVPALAHRAGFCLLEVRRDLAGHPRAVAFRKKAGNTCRP